MKKLHWVLVLPMLALLTGWAGSTALLDPDLVRRAEHEYQARKQRVPQERYLIVIDYRKSIFQTRLWVVDRRTKKVVLASRVSHAFRSGLVYATSFSNVNGSEKSCTGSFVTGATYRGKFGYSLRIRGLDAENTNALYRHVIFHEAPFGCYPFSAGCFMTTAATNTRLIELIKGGSFVYVAR